MITKKKQMESILEKKSVSSMEWTNTIRMLKTLSLMKLNKTRTYVFLFLNGDWLNYSHLNSSNLSRLNIPYSISCRQKKKSWLIWNQSLIFIFYPATAVATVVCHLYFPCISALLLKKAGLASFPHYLLIHSFIHFPLKRKKNP